MHPLGLNLDFLFGHGYLSARNRALSQWVTLELLRMEIPDLSFPFDARGGVNRFRNTRCQVREIQLLISESGLQEALSQALENIQGFQDLRIRFVDGAVHATVHYNTLGSDTFITFKASVIPPEPAKADALHLLLYDVRAYGPLPYPARLLVSELASRLLEAPNLQRRGRGRTFEVAQQGDLLELHPLKLAMLQLFPAQGWKIPSLAGVRYESISLQPGSLSLTARSESKSWEDRSTTDIIGAHIPGEGAARAIAAYEARDLCRDADERLWHGEIDSALEILRGIRHRYGLHPAVYSRTFDLLLAAPRAGNQAEAKALQQEILRGNPDNLYAHLAGPTIALIRGDRAQAIEAYGQLALLLRKRGENNDLIASLLATAKVLKRVDPSGAVRVLREVTQISPRNRQALEILRDLYFELDRTDDLIDALRRLAGLLVEREPLLEVYQQLAELLMKRRGDLGEARLYLEKILSLNPDRVETLCTLGESYILDGQPHRALNALNRASRSAEKSGDPELTASLQLKIASLWNGPLNDQEGALLASRRALDFAPRDQSALQLATDLAIGLKRYDSALEFSERLIPLAEVAVDVADNPNDRASALSVAREVHIQAALIANERGRPDTASAHHRRALNYRRTAGFPHAPQPDPSVEFLDEHFRRMGRPEDLLELYREEINSTVLTPPRRAELHLRMATIFDQAMGLVSEAVEQIRYTLEYDPNSEKAINNLVTLLTRTQRHYELRDVLRQIQLRITDRRTRGLALMHLGDIHLSALPDSRAATEIFRQAQILRPADATLAEHLVEAERMLRRDDPQVAPRSLLRALERLGEISHNDETRRNALIEAGDLCYTDLQSPEQAADFYSRAQHIRKDPQTTARLEEIHQGAGYGQQRPFARVFPGSHPEPTPAPAPEAQTDIRDVPPSQIEIVSSPPTYPQAPPRLSEIRQETPRPEPIPAPKAAPTPPPSPAPEPPRNQKGVATFREKLQSLLSKPVNLADTRLDLLRARPQQDELPSLPAPRFPTPAEPMDDLDIPLAGEILDSLHEELLEEQRYDAPPRAPDSHQFADRDPYHGLPDPPTSSGENVVIPDAPAPLTLKAVQTAPPLQRKPALGGDAHAAQTMNTLTAIITARESGNPMHLRDALEHALSDESLDQKLRAQFSRELGQLYYYDLEQIAIAEEYLSTAIEMDPEGAGADFNVLTALEGIYDDLGEPEKLLGIYRRKQNYATDHNMRQVYSLLIAELLWERLQRPQEAQDTLEEILAKEPDNAPARTMLAEIAKGIGDIPRALDLFRDTVQRQPESSFALQEGLRDLGELLVQHATELSGEPTQRQTVESLRREAIDIYKRLLTEVIGDSISIAALKVLLEQTRRFDELLRLLGTELEVLLGRRDAFPDGPDASNFDPSTVPSALTLPVSQILTDAGICHLHLEQPEDALACFRMAMDAWPENVDALAKRIDLLRDQANLAGQQRPEHLTDLADCLEQMSHMLLDPLERFHHLREAALIYLERLDRREHARHLMEEAIAMTEGSQDPVLLQAIDDVRIHLQSLQDVDYLAQLVSSAEDDDPPSNPQDHLPVPDPSQSMVIPQEDESPTPPTQPNQHTAITQKMDAFERSENTPEFPQDPPTNKLDPDVAQSLGSVSVPPPDPFSGFGATNKPTQKRRNPFGMPDFSTEDNDPFVATSWATPSSGPSFLDPPPALIEDEDPSTFPSFSEDSIPSRDLLQEVLEHIATAEKQQDHAGMLEWIGHALDMNPEDVPEETRYLLLVKRSSLYLVPSPNDEAPRTLSEDEINNALNDAHEAVQLEGYYGSRAYFLSANALQTQGRHAEAINILIKLASDIAIWDKDPGDTGPIENYSLEESIIQNVLDILTQGRLIDQRDQALHRLRATNPRVARVIRRMQLLTNGHLTEEE